jgi:hypothetical protein
MAASEQATSWWGELIRSCLPWTTARRPPSSPALSASNANNTILPLVTFHPDPAPSTEPMLAVAAQGPEHRQTDRETEITDSGVWRTLKLGLSGLEESLGIFPPLKVAVGGLIVCVRQFEVREQTCSQRANESEEVILYRPPHRIKRSTSSLLQISRPCLKVYRCIFHIPNRNGRHTLLKTSHGT